jgi:hypothetical protein
VGIKQFVQMEWPQLQELNLCTDDGDVGENSIGSGGAKMLTKT